MEAPAPPGPSRAMRFPQPGLLEKGFQSNFMRPDPDKEPDRLPGAPSIRHWSQFAMLQAKR